MGTIFIEFQVPRNRAEARIAVGSAPPYEVVAIICMRNADFPKNGESLVSASVRNTLAFLEVSGRMRRLLGPRRDVARRDALLAANFDAVSEGGDFAGWAAYCNAKKKRERRRASR